MTEKAAWIGTIGMVSAAIIGGLFLFLTNKPSTLFFQGHTPDEIADTVIRKQKEQDTIFQALQTENAQLKKALSDAVEALVNAQAPGIETAIEALQLGQTEEAESIFRQVIEQNTGETAAAYRHIGALSFLTDTRKSLAAYRKSTELDRDYAQDWNQLGHLLRRIGQLNEAERTYKEVLRIAEKKADRILFAVAYGNLGIIYKPEEI